MDASDITGAAQGKYNQAMFLQLRLHELWLRIDRMSTNMLDTDPMFKIHNYEVVVNDLGSILRVVRPYLKQTPKETITKSYTALRKTTNEANIWGKRDVDGNKYITFDRNAWNVLQEKIYQFELDLEDLAHKHGLGNPTKDDPTMAVIN